MSLDAAPPVPESNFFSLTSGEDNPYDEKKKSPDPIRQQKNRFETPAEKTTDIRSSRGSLKNMYVNNKSGAPSPNSAALRSSLNSNTIIKAED